MKQKQRSRKTGFLKNGKKTTKTEFMQTKFINRKEIRIRSRMIVTASSMHCILLLFCNTIHWWASVHVQTEITSYTGRVRERPRSPWRSKRRQIQNGDNQNGDTSKKRRHTKTATHPKRRHTKIIMATHPKRRHVKTATNPKRRHVKKPTIQLDLSPKLPFHVYIPFH